MKVALTRTDAAVIFHHDGTLSLCIPKIGEAEIVPDNVAAAAETFLLFRDPDDVEELAQRFRRRVGDDRRFDA